MLSLLKWFLMAGGAIGLGTAWAAVRGRETIPMSAKVMAGAATGIGIANLLRTSPFVWIAVTVGSVLFGLELAIPVVQDFLGEFPHLYFVIPYFSAAGIAAIVSGETFKRVMGTIVLIAGAVIFLYDSVAFAHWQSYQVTVAAGADGEYQIPLPAGYDAWWKVEDVRGMALFEIRGENRIELFGCNDTPWSNAFRRGTGYSLLLFHSCRATSSTFPVQAARSLF